MAVSPSSYDTSPNTHAASQIEVLARNDEQQDQEQPPPPVLRLRLQKPKNQKKVVWDQNTVDNENMGKKKSKCCCVYKKPTVFDESSSESEEECEHCSGHPEKRKHKKDKLPKYDDYECKHSKLGASDNSGNSN